MHFVATRPCCACPNLFPTNLSNTGSEPRPLSPPNTKKSQTCRPGFNQILPCICHCVRLRRCQSFPTIGRTARLLIPTQLRINEKAPANYAGAFSFIWRRERDSNPRYAINVYTLSRRAPSATQPSLQIVVFFRRLSKLLINYASALDIRDLYITAGFNALHEFLNAAYGREILAVNQGKPPILVIKDVRRFL